MSPRFSIIIPVKEINDYVRETVPHIQKLQNPKWELIILPNNPEANEWHDEKIQIVPSGRVGPADKRDMGSKIAKGDILVFLDDDSYPKADLLNVAEQYFKNPEVVAIGGPGITPPHDNFWQKVSGAVFSSCVGGGVPERYIPLGQVKEVDDWPSVNLMVRKQDFLDIGGFNSKFWPGEDTKLCSDLIEKTKKKILYVPELIVWHHRRGGFFRHLKQVGGYGLHRGFFAKKYPETSLKLFYFIPSAFLIFATASLFFVFYPIEVQKMILTGWGLYILALLKAFIDFVKHTHSISVAFLAVVYTIFTHLSYGVKFLQGFIFTQKLISKLR